MKDFKPFSIYFPGECYVKKNCMKELWFRYSKNSSGARIKTALQKPIKYYTKNYEEWALTAVNSLIIQKQKLIKQGYKFPIQSPVVMISLFFSKSVDTVRDTSNLIESPQDVLAGNPGASKTKNISTDLYQILYDDKSSIVKIPLGQVILDKATPRTQVVIVPYQDDSLGRIINAIAPGTELILNHEDYQGKSIDVNADLFKDEFNYLGDFL